MARQARGEYLDPHREQIVHCTQRCVRRAFLCGKDKYTGNCYEHRRGWTVKHLRWQAEAFAIETLTYCVMGNHLHLVLRTRPDLVANWSDQEVARRWLLVYPKRRNNDGSPCEPSQKEINKIANNRKRIKELRTRLSDISWWMKCLAERIARMANKEDDVTGRFWQGRFHAELLLDEPSVLACCIYVDLNPIRAQMAKTPEESEFTGAHDRIEDLRYWLLQGDGNGPPVSDVIRSIHAWERYKPIKTDWLAPIQIDQQNDPVGPDPCDSGKRPSRKGFLSISLTTYLDLVDWTGRQLHEDKRGKIPEELDPILQRIGLEADSWCELVAGFGRLFKRVAGTPASIEAETQRRGQSWMQAPALKLFQAN